MVTGSSSRRTGIDWGQVDDLSEESVGELLEDLSTLAYLVQDARTKLERLGTDLELHASDLRETTLGLLRTQASAERARYRRWADALRSLRRRASSPSADPSGRIAELEDGKASLADLLRSQRAVTAALAIAADWQSPSFMHSTTAAAGRQGGLITPHWNDYKRDRHLDAEVFERAYLAEMVEGPSDLRALLTGCGMAAFTTVLNFMLMEGRLDGPVLVGRGVYHESKHLLRRALPRLVSEVDERDTAALVASMQELRPVAIFLDSLSNTKRTVVPNLEAVLGALPSGTYLVLDNTGLSATFQPFRLAERIRTDLSGRLIVFESLLKYAQLGLDRVNAGVIVGRGPEADTLADYREHLGTNASDFAAHVLPTPDRGLLQRRLARLERNATLIADRLEATLARDEAGPVEGIFYPGLAGHPSHPVARRLPFRGACVSVAFRSDQDPAPQRALVEDAIAEARARAVPLLAGSSFGFDVTRIYVTAARSEEEPFVRVSSGTEHRLAAEAVADVLAGALGRALGDPASLRGPTRTIGGAVAA